MLIAILGGWLVSVAALAAAAPGGAEVQRHEAPARPAPAARRLWVVPRTEAPGPRVTVLGYLHPDSWLVEASVDALAGSDAVPFDDSRKTAPALRRFAKRVTADRAVGLEIVLHPGADPEHLAATLGKRMPELTLTGRRGGPPRRLIGRLAAVRLDDVLDRLQDRPEVLWVDRYRPPRWLNADSVEPIQANADSGMALPTITPIWDQGLVGTGQIIAVADSGLDRNEAWFSRYHDGATLNAQITDAVDTLPPATGTLFINRKVVAYWVMPGASPYDENESAFHGTHVTGTAAGDVGAVSRPGIANYDIGDGMAPHAQILFQDLGNASGSLSGVGGAAMWAQALAGGAHIHSNSYGASPTGGYNASDAEIDNFLWQNEGMLIVFAAGNEGAGTMTINHPGNAKHALTVGALNHGASTVVAGFSSRGPASDGRIKPDLMAPGVNIISARGNANDTTLTAPATTRFDGTSMATPAVAGAAALSRQYFVDGFYPTGVPLADDRHSASGVLLKAILLNGTRTYPDTPATDTGWGRVWLDNNLHFNGDARSLRVWSLPNDAGLIDAQFHEYSVQVGAGEEFRATLVWYDPAPSLASTAALVNNLDLVVTTPSMQTIRGNVFSAGESAQGGLADLLNPVEQVRFAAPAAGQYTLRVDASGVLGNGQPGSDRQGYALVVSAAGCPTGVTAAPDFTLSPDSSGVQIDLMTVPGADRYQYYRAVGGCAVDLASLQFAGAGSGPGLLDETTQGGFRYAYRVRGADACGEGPISVCRELVSQAPCTLAPDFDPAAATPTPLGSFCAVDLSWSEAMARCPGATAVGYQVHRSTDPFFEPEPATMIVDGLTLSRFTDYQAPPGVTHYYRVVAIDDLGNAAPPTEPAAYAAVATETMPGTYVDGGEALALATLESPWRLTDQDASSGARSYRNGPDGIGYPPNACAALTTRPIPLQAGAGLSYAARYELESGWDGVVVEISANGGASWTDLPPTGGYPDGFSLTGSPPANACAYPATQGAFSGTAAGFVSHSSDLSAWAGETVLIRWRFSSDPGVELDGFYLDDISVTNAETPLACVSGELLFASGYE